MGGGGDTSGALKLALPHYLNKGRGTCERGRTPTKIKHPNVRGLGDQLGEKKTEDMGGALGPLSKKEREKTLRLSVLSAGHQTVPKRYRLSPQSPPSPSALLKTLKIREKTPVDLRNWKLGGEEK